MGNLTAVQCKTLGDGKHSDGDGLRLVVKNGGTSRAWTLAYTSPTTGKRREIGLGKFESVGLLAARELAKDRREEVRQRIDPIEAAAALKAAGAAQQAAAKAAATHDYATLRRVARKHHEKISAAFKNEKHAAQWINSIEQHVPAKLLDKPIADVTAGELLDFIQPLYLDLPETGRRVRQRLEVVFANAILRGQCDANPAAAIKAALKSKRGDKGAFRALDYKDVPAFVARLRGQPGNAARALEFAILTASRTSEVLGATWDEIRGDTWTVPASRMKAGKPHVVHLSTAAIAVLAQMRKALPEADFVFPSPVNPKKPLSNMAMLVLLRRLEMDDVTTVHGFRAAFSSWCYATQQVRGEAIEYCLAHKEPDAVKRSYMRDPLLADRAALLDAWGDYAAPLNAKAKVVKMRGAGR